MPSFFAIVPMKAHSARVPGKNIRDFNGKPLFYWIFKTLHATPYVSRIILDTDAKAIAEQVQAFFPGILISMRPPHLHGDTVSTNALIAHILTLFPEQDYFLQTHATNPGLTAATIERAIAAFAQDNIHDSLFTVCRLQARLFDRNGHPLNHDPRNLIPTQDLDPIYEENSNLYLFTRAAFAAAEGRIGARPRLFEVDRSEAFDIDTEDDFLMAQLLHKRSLAAHYAAD